MRLHHLLVLALFLTAQVMSELSHNPHLPRAIDVKKEFDAAWCKGAKLLMAMLRSEEKAAGFITPVRSKWDGDLASSFSTWGYKEGPACDALCDFADHNLQRAFEELKIGTASSADGRPNKCYHLEHQYGPTVEHDQSGQWPDLNNQWYNAGGKRLRETQAITDLGINSAFGALYFFNRISPKQAAHDNWGIDIDKVKPELLPDLAASSDHAWGFWNREHPNGGLEKIEKILICMITNSVTLALIQYAIDTYPLPPGINKEQRPKGAEKWPGVTFAMELDVAHALLVGYFLAQHKHRFGKSKTVDRVQVFRPDKDMMPYMLFYVEDAPDVPGISEAAMSDDDGGSGANATAKDKGPTVEQRVVKRGKDGKNVVREHVFRARL